MKIFCRCIEWFLGPSTLWATFCGLPSVHKRKSQMKQARKGFRPISSRQKFFGNFLGIFWGFFGNGLRFFWDFFGNSFKIFWEFYWNFLGILMIFFGMDGWGVLIWDFFGKFLRILWDFFGISFGILLEFFGNSIGILLDFFWNLKLHTDTKLWMWLMSHSIFDF